MNCGQIDFYIDEIFFSKSDFYGKIQFGNDVFERVCEYSLQDMVGKSHNIIRHKDMPREFFHCFWEFLLRGDPFVGYIKNKTKNENYYWVLGLVVPVEEGYLSIRIKPTSKILTKIKEIYKEVNSAEVDSRDISSGLLLFKITKLGFDSYYDFMVHSISEEMKHRANSISNESKSNKLIHSEFLQDMDLLCNVQDTTEVMGSFIYQVSESFVGIRNTIDELISCLDSGACVSSSSISSAINSFSSWTFKAEEALGKFKLFNNHLFKKIDSVKFQTAKYYLEVEMATTFRRNMGAKEIEYISVLDKLADEGLDKSRSSLEDMYSSIGEFKALFFLLRDTFMSLDIDEVIKSDRTCYPRNSDESILKNNDFRYLVSFNFRRLESLFKLIDNSLHELRLHYDDQKIGSSSRPSIRFAKKPFL